jgi:membrane protein implicated in regulation of membrane protease activity
VGRALLALALILALFPALVLAPFELGAIRIAGVSLAWWYGGAVAPLLVLVLVVLVLKARPDRRDRSP